jgi:hypothetical protein
MYKYLKINLQKETSTYCKQMLLKVIIPTKISDNGNTDKVTGRLNLTIGKSFKIDDCFLDRVPSPICPNTIQIKQVMTH